VLCMPVAILLNAIEKADVCLLASFRGKVFHSSLRQMSTIQIQIQQPTLLMLLGGMLRDVWRNKSDYIVLREKMALK
jgi:hypothetical protein